MDPDGNFTLTGSSYDAGIGKHEILMQRIDANGNQLWFKKFGGVEDDWGTNLLKDGEDNIITGTTYSYGSNTPNESMFMLKLDKNGNFK